MRKDNAMVRRNNEEQGSRIEDQGSSIERFEGKACPFCGMPDVKVEMRYGINYVLCDGCGAVVSFRGHEGKDQTIGCWNKRMKKEE